MRRSRWAGLLVSSLAVLFGVTGCGKGVTSPAPPSGISVPIQSASQGERPADPASSWSPILNLRGGGAALYPLELGNRWVHEQHSVEVLIPRGGDPQFLYEQRSTLARGIVCEEAIGGRTYRVEHQTTLDSVETPFRWVRMRQDARGLYEADVDISVPPPCYRGARDANPPVTPAVTARAAFDRVMERAGSTASRAAWQTAWQRQELKLEAARAFLAGGITPESFRRDTRLPPEGELLRLAAPLRPGGTWVVRRDPRFTSTIEAFESLAMPAGRFEGYRIRMGSEFFGPQDRVLTWYGKDGYLRGNYHIVSDAITDAGTRVGALVFDFDEVLVQIALVGRSGGGPILSKR